MAYCQKCEGKQQASPHLNGYKINNDRMGVLLPESSGPALWSNAARRGRSNQCSYSAGEYASSSCPPLQKLSTCHDFGSHGTLGPAVIDIIRRRKKTTARMRTHDGCTPSASSQHGIFSLDFDHYCALQKLATTMYCPALSLNRSNTIYANLAAPHKSDLSTSLYRETTAAVHAIGR